MQPVRATGAELRGHLAEVSRRDDRAYRVRVAEQLRDERSGDLVKRGKLHEDRPVRGQRELCGLLRGVDQWQCDTLGRR